MDPIVDTTSGKIRGASISSVQVFKGIPYGGATGGDMRFKPPVKPQPWPGVRDALSFGPTAPQASHAEAGGGGTGGRGAERMAQLMAFIRDLSGDEPPMGEDCLALNVWTGGVADGRRRPVLFYIHGGAFTTGSGSWTLYDGLGLARRGDAVLVTVNHRLGALGYLHLAAFGGVEYAHSGNAGMLDLVLALEWVRDNIEAFGGDPRRVLVMGSSGGASKTATLLAMPRASCLFQRANLMSGPMLRAASTEHATAVAERLLTRLGIAPADFRKLHDVPAARLVLEAEHVGAPIGSALAGAAKPEQFMPLQPVVDGEVLPAHPMDPVPSPHGVDVPVMIGSAKDDMTLLMFASPWFGALDNDGLEKMARSFFGHATETVLAEYRREKPSATPTEIACQIVTDRTMWTGSIEWAERRAKAACAPTYVYRFDFETPAFGGLFGAAHGGDIPFALNNAGSAMAGDRPDNPAMAKMMSDTWVAFAATGNPNNGALPPWQPYDPAQRATMLFDLPPHVESDPRARIRRLLAAVA